VDAVRRLLVMFEHPATHARLLPVTALIAAAAAVVVVLTHGSGTAVTAAAAPTTPSTPSTSVTATPGPAPGKAHHASPSARGELTALDGDSWTLSSTEGATITIAVNAQTTFGTVKTPMDRARFSVGTQVAVTGPRSGDTVNAERINIPLTPRCHHRTRAHHHRTGAHHHHGGARHGGAARGELLRGQRRGETGAGLRVQPRRTGRCRGG